MFCSICSQFRSDDDYCEAVLVWEFCVLPPAPTMAVVTDHSSSTDESGFPLVQRSSMCNCFARSVGKVLLNDHSLASNCI